MLRCFLRRVPSVTPLSFQRSFCSVPNYAVLPRFCLRPSFGCRPTLVSPAMTLPVLRAISTRYYSQDPNPLFSSSTFREGSSRTTTQSPTPDPNDSSGLFFGRLVAALILVFLLPLAVSSRLRRYILSRLSSRFSSSSTSSDQASTCFVVSGGRQIVVSDEILGGLRILLSLSSKEGIDLSELISRLLEDRAELESEFEEAFLDQKKAALEETNTLVKEVQNELSLKYARRNTARIERLKELILKVSALEGVYAAKARYVRNSRKFQKITLATISLLRALEKDHVPIRNEVEWIQEASRGDSLLEFCMGEIPEETRARGVASVTNLTEELRSLKDAVRVEFQKEKGKRKKALSTVVSKDVPTPFVDRLFEKCVGLIQQNEIEAAVAELSSSLNEECLEVVQPWIGKASARSDVVEVVRIIEDHLTNLSGSIS